MNFREWYLNENKSYVAYLGRDNSYNVRLNTPSQLAALTKMNPVKTWYFAINPGEYRLNVPGASPDEVEKIGEAYYKFLGKNGGKQASLSDLEDTGPTIDPEVFRSRPQF